MKKNIVIIILSILVIGLSGYLVYDKVLDKDDLEDIQQNENNQNAELKTVYNKDSSWINYLNSVNITSVKLSFVNYDSGYPVPVNGEEISLSKEEIDTLFDYMNNGVLTSNYFPFAVPSVYDYLKIEYDDGKWVMFYDLKFIETNDSKLEEYLIQDVGDSEYWYRSDWTDSYFYELYNK